MAGLLLLLLLLPVLLPLLGVSGSNFLPPVRACGQDADKMHDAWEARRVRPQAHMAHMPQAKCQARARLMMSMM